ncbi:MAG: hypothetical protein HC828_12590 [Blastochloris sp.]|nr:hypothetical protein [Blastochloris sp.]
MAEQRVVIKGNKDGLWVTLKPDDSWQHVTGDLAARIDQQSAFFAGARITLDVGARPLRKDELSSVKAMLERRGMEFVDGGDGEQTTMESANALGPTNTFCRQRRRSCSRNSPPAEHRPAP